MKRKLVAVFQAQKRIVVFLTVWTMALAGVLASGVVLASPASAAVPGVGAYASLPLASALPDLFNPLPTVRVFSGMATTTPRLVQIAGLGGVPADATAVVVNTQVSAPTAAGYVRVTPAGLNPGVATQVFVKGQTISNLVVVKLVGGKIQVKLSAGSAKVFMDVSGYYRAGVGASFMPLPTARVFSGIATTTPRLVQIAGLGGVPADATAVVVNTQVSAPTAAGYVRVTPAGLNPGVATQEFVKGQTISNLVVVKLVGGKIQVKLSAGSAKVFMDVSGYYRFPDVTAPAAVTGLAATVVSDTSIRLAWANPANADFTGVTIRRALGATAPTTAASGTPVTGGVATATSYIDTGLTAGTQYSYAVFAHDGALNHAVAGNVTATTKPAPDVTAPGPVTGLTATPTTTSATVMVRLTWTNPSIVTSPDFAGVTIRRAPGLIAPATRTDGVLVVSDTATAATSYNNIDGLAADTQYSYAVFAHDTSGNYNTAATEVTVKTDPTPPVLDTTAPGPVTGLTATAASDTSIDLAWVNPGDVDFAGVTIRRANGPTPPATFSSGDAVADTAATAMAFTDTGRIAGTQYSYALFSYDLAGNHAVAVTKTATTNPAPDITPPGPVTGLTATAASDTSIALVWVNPTAADFTGVTIRRLPGATAPTITTGTLVTETAAMAFTDTALTAGTQYSYAVFAHDGVPNYAARVTVSATTMPPPDTTAPASVTALAATVASDTSIKLDWANPADADFTGVTIRRALGGTAPATASLGTPVTGGVATATSYIDTGLAVGQQYSYAVFAHDGSGNSADPANVTAATTTISRPTAVLSVNSSHGLTAKTSVGGFTASFDVSGSLAGAGSTLVSAVLDFGDGTPTESFSGDPANWFSGHGFTTVGDKTVTVVVTNSAGATATDAVTVSVYPNPTATIKVVGPVVLGQPVTFELTSSTPAGTAFTDYDFCYDGIAGPVWERHNGLPPTTTTHTFDVEGTYDAEFYVYNDADGLVLATVSVRVDATPPGPVTNLTSVAGADSITLAWTNPTDADFTGVAIRRILDNKPPTWTTGTLVTDTAISATSFKDTGLPVGTRYTYAAFAHDGSGNHAAAADVVERTLAALPTAVLSINGSTGATAKTSVGGWSPFLDLSGSLAGDGLLVSALLDFGDGTTRLFSGDPATWYSTHDYTTSGDMAVTVVVTNEAGDTDTAAVMVTVHPMPTAAITAPLLARPGDPITLALTLSTPAGTAFTDYDVSFDNGATWEPFNIVPPTTLTHTFSAEGVYTVLLTAYNDADGWADASQQVRVDVTPPAPVTNPVVSVSSVGDTWLSLSWTNPTDTDLTGAMIRRLAGATAPATVTDGDLVSDFNDRADYVINPDLTPGTQYSYTVFAHDGSGNYAAGVSATGTTTGIPPHVVPPGPISALTAVGMAGDTSIKLDWVNPTDADFAGVTIRRLAGGIEPASVTDGDPVAIAASATATSFTDSGLAPGTEYSYSVFAYDVANNHAAGVKVKATTTMVTTAVLLLDTTRATVGTELFFDPALSYAARGETVTEGTLDYGDGTPLEPFTGTADGWYALHSYATAGAYVVTLTVTDSANLTVSKSVTINVLAAETATITAPAGQIKVGVDAVFTLTTTVAPVSHWTVEGDSVGFYFSDWGTPPPTVTYNFTAAGTYTVSFTVDSVNTSIQVTVSP